MGRVNPRSASLKEAGKQPKTAKKLSYDSEPASPPGLLKQGGGVAGLPWSSKAACFTYDSGSREAAGEDGGDRSPDHPLPPFPRVSLDTGKGWEGLGPGPKRALERPLELELPWPNRTGNRAVRHGGGGHYLSKEAVAYRSLVRRALAARRQADLGLAGPYHLHWVLQPPDAAARDFDNLMKVVADAIVWAGLLKDDSNQVIQSGSWEWTAPESPGRILVILKEI